MPGLLGGEGKPRSASTWIGCGCASLVAVFMMAVVVISVLTYRAGKNLEAMTADPERAAAAIRQIVPYGELPAGYRPVGTLEIPFMMKIAFFGGPGASGEPDAFEHGFFVVRVRDLFGRAERSSEWMAGSEVELQPIEQQEFRFEPQEVIDRGELAAGGADVLWLARRGEMRVARIGQDGDEDEVSVEAAEPSPVVLTMMDLGCDDGWQRLGVWFEPAPAAEVAGAAAGEADWSGTPADPAAIEAFLARFALCG